MCPRWYPPLPKPPHLPVSISTRKHLLPRTHRLRFCRFHVSIGLRMRPCFPLHPYSLLPWLLVNVLPVISQACVHLSQTRSDPSNVIPNSLTPRQLIAFAKKSLLLNLCILIINHHLYIPHLHFPNLRSFAKLRKTSPLFPCPHLILQSLIGIKILAYQTSVGPSRH